MSRFIIISSLNVTIVVILSIYHCHCQGNFAGPKEPDLHKNYEILEQLKQPDSGLELRGMGRCMDNVYIFFNIPFLYTAYGSDFAIDEHEIALRKLHASDLFDYSDNEQLLKWVCANNRFCAKLDDDVYMSIYSFQGHCVAYVVRTNEPQPDEAPYTHFFQMFDLHNQLEATHHLKFYGLKGIPFSNCGQQYPIMRFIYQADLVIDDECFHEDFAQLLQYYSGNDRIGSCLNEKARQERSIHSARLLLTSNNSITEYSVFKRLRKLHRASTIKFGTCIDDNYIMITGDNEVHSYALEGQEYNYFGYKYKLFNSSRLSSQRLSGLFNVTVHLMLDDPNDQTARQRSKGVTRYRISYYDITYTDPPPSITDEPFTGMPTKVRRVYLSDGLTPSNKKFFKKYIFFIVIGAVFLILLFLLFLFCLCNIKCFPSRHKRGKGSKQEMIVVHVENPAPPPPPGPARKKKKKESVPKLLPLPPPTMKPIVTPVSPPSPLSNPSPQSLVISKRTESDPLRTYENPTSNTFSTIYKRGR